MSFRAFGSALLLVALAASCCFCAGPASKAAPSNPITTISPAAPLSAGEAEGAGALPSPQVADEKGQW